MSIIAVKTAQRCNVFYSIYGLILRNTEIFQIFPVYIVAVSSYILCRYIHNVPIDNFPY